MSSQKKIVTHRSSRRSEATNKTHAGLSNIEAVKAKRVPAHTTSKPHIPSRDIRSMFKQMEKQRGTATKERDISKKIIDSKSGDFVCFKPGSGDKMDAGGGI